MERIKFLFLIIVASLIPTPGSYRGLRPELVRKKDDRVDGEKDERDGEETGE